MAGFYEFSAIASGGVVGLTLGLVGGGGSILAVPLLVHVVGVSSPHLAIGTSAVAVAASAAASLFGHFRAGTVKWPCAIVFAIAGIVGAAVGAALGKAVDGNKLLALFGVLMIIVGGAMLRPQAAGEKPDVKLTSATAARLLPLLIGVGFAVGTLSGFFGIGGGFLVVPGLIGATSMSLINAIGSSLLSVTAFGSTTAASYAWSGLADWPVAGLFLLGGTPGALLGIRLGRGLASRKRVLTVLFAGLVMIVGLYVLTRALTA